MPEGGARLPGRAGSAAARVGRAGREAGRVGREAGVRARALWRGDPGVTGLLRRQSEADAERRAVVAHHTAAVRARERLLRRARTQASGSAAVATVGAGVAVAAEGSVVYVAAVGTGLVLARGVAALRVLRRPPPPVPDPQLPPALPAPPPSVSAAYPLLERVEAAGDGLRALLGPLRQAGPGDPDAVVPAAAAALEAVARARYDLWTQAARVAGVEDALRRTADPRARVELERAWVTLLDGLASAAAAHERLLTTAAELLAAETVGSAGARLALERVQEAADRLAGLAHGLRTLEAGRTVHVDPGGDLAPR